MSRFYTKAVLHIEGQPMAAFIIHSFDTYTAQQAYHEGPEIQRDTMRLMDKCEVMYGYHDSMRLDLVKVNATTRSQVL